MNYDWLFSFATFAEHLNFTRAAESLHISQPALHVQVRRLTEAVGRPLYRKEGRRLFLTPDGERLAAFGRHVREAGDNLVAEIQGGVARGPLVLVSGPGAFLHLLGKAIRLFPKTRWPLRLKTMPGPEAIEAVRAAQAHLAVVATNDVPSDLDARPLCEVGQSVVLPSDHRLAKRTSVKPLDLSNEPLVVAPEGSPHRTMLAQLFGAAGAQLNVAVEATGWEVMLAFAKYRIGATVVNDFCPPPRGMVAVPLRGAPPINYYALSRPGLRSPSLDRMNTLIDRHIGAG